MQLINGIFSDEVFTKLSYKSRDAMYNKFEYELLDLTSSLQTALTKKVELIYDKDDHTLEFHSRDEEIEEYDYKKVEDAEKHKLQVRERMFWSWMEHMANCCDVEKHNEERWNNAIKYIEKKIDDEESSK